MGGVATEVFSKFPGKPCISVCVSASIHTYMHISIHMYMSLLLSCCFLLLLPLPFLVLLKSIWSRVLGAALLNAAGVSRTSGASNVGCCRCLWDVTGTVLLANPHFSTLNIQEPL